MTDEIPMILGRNRPARADWISLPKPWAEISDSLRSRARQASEIVTYDGGRLRVEDGQWAVVEASADAEVALRALSCWACRFGVRETMRYEIEIKERRPYLVGENGFEIVRWFPSDGGLMIAGLASSQLLTNENSDLEAVKRSLGGLITAP